MVCHPDGCSWWDSAPQHCWLNLGPESISPGGKPGRAAWKDKTLSQAPASHHLQKPSDVPGVGGAGGAAPSFIEVG